MTTALLTASDSTTYHDCHCLVFVVWSTNHITFMYLSCMTAVLKHCNIVVQVATLRILAVIENTKPERPPCDRAVPHLERVRHAEHVIRIRFSIHKHCSSTKIILSIKKLPSFPCLRATLVYLQSFQQVPPTHRTICHWSFPNCFWRPWDTACQAIIRCLWNTLSVPLYCDALYPHTPLQLKTCPTSSAPPPHLTVSLPLTGLWCTCLQQNCFTLFFCSSQALIETSIGEMIFPKPATHPRSLPWYPVATLRNFL